MNEFHDDEIINQFVIESLDLIGTAVEPDRLVLERDRARVSPAIISNLFQVMNNIKEIAGMLGFEAIKTLGSAMEELFLQFMLFRDEKLVPDPDKIDVLFAGVDKLRTMFQDKTDSLRIVRASFPPVASTGRQSHDLRYSIRINRLVWLSSTTKTFKFLESPSFPTRIPFLPSCLAKSAVN